MWDYSDKHGLTSDLVNRLLYDDSLRFCSDQVAAEMAEQPSPAEIAEVLMRKLKTTGNNCSVLLKFSTRNVMSNIMSFIT